MIYEPAFAPLVVTPSREDLEFLLQDDEPRVDLALHVADAGSGREIPLFDYDWKTLDEDAWVGGLGSGTRASGP